MLNGIKMMKFENIKMIEVGDWDKLVSKTYNKIYSFQQQNGCQSRGIHYITIPSEYTCDDDMNDVIPEIINGNIMGVKFKKWLERDIKETVGGETGTSIDLWWKRNFYPDINTVANELYERGLIEAGEYIINIDW